MSCAWALDGGCDSCSVKRAIRLGHGDRRGDGEENRDDCTERRASLGRGCGGQNEYQNDWDAEGINGSAV